MASAVLLPKLGNSVESSIILAWHKAVGDPVATGDILAEIETDKATLEVESPADGLLLARFYEAGAEVTVMAPIGAIGAAGEDVADLQLQAAGPPTHEVASQEAQAPQSPQSSQPLQTARGRPASSPRARRLAAARGLPLDGLTGSGPGGRILERDVQAAPARGSGSGGRIRRGDLIPAPQSEAVVRVPLRGPRRVTARRMLESLQTTAQLTLHAPADARALLSLRQQLKSGAAGADLRAVTINDLLHLAVARTLPAHPALNAQLVDDHILQHRAVHLGFAVDSPRGLFVPVIRDADRLNPQQLASEARRLAHACREGRVRPEELEGGTFTVSNLGTYGIESFTPVLNPPQAGILGVGAIHLKAVTDDGGVAFRPHVSLSLTIDHQVLDGAPAARFLQDLAQVLARIDQALAADTRPGVDETS